MTCFVVVMRVCFKKKKKIIGCNVELLLMYIALFVSGVVFVSLFCFAKRMTMCIYSSILIVLVCAEEFIVIGFASSCFFSLIGLLSAALYQNTRVLRLL